MEIEPLTPTIGAVIHGIDLSHQMDDATVDTLKTAWARHCVLFFHNQTLDTNSLRVLGQRLGRLFHHPSGWAEEIESGIIKVHTDSSSTHKPGAQWHSDLSCIQTPPHASLLYLHESPKLGGDTLFVNTADAYAKLSKTMRGWLEGLTAEHGWRYAEDKHAEVKAAHPLVITHPVTRAKALFVNEVYTRSVFELHASESESLLEFLYQHIRDVRFQCRFRWRKNSVAWWDNRVTQHLALWDYHPQTRSGLRLTLGAVS